MIRLTPIEERIIMTHTIREATSQDTQLITEFIINLTGKTISPIHVASRLLNMLDLPDERLYVYVEHGRLQGTLGFRIRRSEGTAVTFGEASLLAEATPRQQLADFAEQLASDHGCSGIWWLSCLPSEPGALTADPRHADNALIGSQENGYRFVKQFL
ncbi:hypothetical protein [Paenibacillus whitsoniae]|uniref:N-acetyltransferase domain-containing protein n=1 Tax=Paenibacillus whitsoniae TaxID=2496558 RepID=A0A3S0A3K2_9BACL|nr:hypothetical protein [Paenibacillus whitsoniae]RTE08695.1 hypothetical protein EJQ19_16045 [Paenibacillus whitsoniae]